MRRPVSSRARSVFITKAPFLPKHPPDTLTAGYVHHRFGREIQQLPRIKDGVMSQQPHIVVMQGMLSPGDLNASLTEGWGDWKPLTRKPLSMRAVGQVRKTLACSPPSMYLNSSRGGERNSPAPAPTCHVEVQTVASFSSSRGEGLQGEPGREKRSRGRDFSQWFRLALPILCCWKVKLEQASRETESNWYPSPGTQPLFHLGTFCTSLMLSFLLCKRGIRL